ncbi:hypothetical protein C8R45DRAFT_970128 [Mycena sanguinolenta]|nr:hypothetical protein C8R45DRAFT_970128 [Mycena sanguinolenta]
MFHCCSRNRGVPLRSIVADLSAPIRGEDTTGCRFVAVSVETPVPYAVDQQLCDLRVFQNLNEAVQILCGSANDDEGFRRWISKGLEIFIHRIVLHTQRVIRQTFANARHCSDLVHQPFHTLGKRSRSHVGRLMVYSYQSSPRTSAGNFDYGDDICRECSGASTEAKVIGLFEEFLKCWVFEHLGKMVETLVFSRHYYGGRRRRQPNTSQLFVYESVLGNNIQLEKTPLGDG